jgi:AAA15 family ATPase/GTPase
MLAAQQYISGAARMYTSFHIQNFRGFADLELTDLGRINLIAGKNNVGKTSLLLAIWFLSGYHEEVLKEILFSLKEKNLVDTPYQFDILFNKYNTIKPVYLKSNLSHADAKNIRINFLNDKATISNEKIRYRDAEYKGDVQLIAVRLDSMNVYNILVDETRMFGARSSISISTSLIRANQIVSFKEDSKLFSQLILSKQTDLLIRSLRLIEPRLLDIKLLANGFYVDIEGISKLLPLTTMGEGINRVASIMLAMSHVQNGVLLIDEIENGLHYSVMEQVWKTIGEAARQFNVQIFATTHSLEMIRAAHEAFKDDDPYDFRLHRLDRNETTGEITRVTFNKAIMDAVTNLEYEVRG